MKHLDRILTLFELFLTEVLLFFFLCVCVFMCACLYLHAFVLCLFKCIRLGAFFGGGGKGGGVVKVYVLQIL